jgi:hypothetical protein
MGLKVERKRVISAERRYYYEEGKCLNDHDEPVFEGRCRQCKNETRMRAYWAKTIREYLMSRYPALLETLAG